MDIPSVLTPEARAFYEAWRIPVEQARIRAIQQQMRRLAEAGILGMGIAEPAYAEIERAYAEQVGRMAGQLAREQALAQMRREELERQRQFQREMFERQIQAQRQLMEEQRRIQMEMMWQQMLGQLVGMGVGALVSPALGALVPALVGMPAPARLQQIYPGLPIAEMPPLGFWERIQLQMLQQMGYPSPWEWAILRAFIGGQLPLLTPTPTPAPTPVPTPPALQYLPPITPELLPYG